MEADRQKQSFLSRAVKHGRRRLIAGVLVVVPLWVTFIALKFLFNLLDGIFGPLAEQWLGFSIPGLGFIVLVIILYLIGLVATNIMGRSLINLGESILNKIPIVRNIYRASKQITQTFSISSSWAFKRVVVVEYPRPGLHAIAFVTNTMKDEKNRKTFISVFIPTSPNPTSGYLEFVPQEQVHDTDLTIEEGIKMVISGGLIVPEGFSPRKK